MPRHKASASRASSEPSFREQLRKLAERPINEGRPVVADQLTPYNTATIFHQLNWTTFLNLPSSIYPRRIREFYALFSYNEDNDTVSFTVGSNHFEFTLQHFGNFLGIPSSGLRFYSDSHNLSNLPNPFVIHEVISSICKPSVSPNTTHLHGKDLLDECAVWNKIIDSNMFPKSGHHSEISVTQALLLHALKTNSEVNVAHIIAKRMCGLPNGRRDLPYGRLLSLLFLNLDGLPPMNPTPATSVPINLTTLKKMSSHAGKKRAHSSSLNTEEEIDRFQFVEGGDEGESSIPHEFGTSEGTMEERITSLHRSVSELRREHRSLRKEVKGVKGMLRKIMDVLGCNHGSDEE